jgi:hypothetical protein
VKYLPDADGLIQPLDRVLAEERRRRRSAETTPPPIGTACRIVTEADDFFSLTAIKTGGR